MLDQLQYLNWLRQAGEHVLIANLYDLAPGPRTFLHPGVLVSGRCTRSAGGRRRPTSSGSRSPCSRCGRARWRGPSASCPKPAAAARRVALALFFASPVAALVGWLGLGRADARFDFDFLGGELTADNYLWGYLFTAIAVGLLPLGLLAHERGRHRLRPPPPGSLVAWLQPWQGATYLLVLGGAELLRGGGGARCGRVALVGARPRRRRSSTTCCSRGSTPRGSSRAGRTTSATGRGGSP